MGRGAAGCGVGARLGLRDCATAATEEATTLVTLVTAARRLAEKDGPESEELTADAKAVGDDSPWFDKSVTTSKLTSHSYEVRCRTGTG